jgi:hypothetical protein
MNQCPKCRGNMEEGFVPDNAHLGVVPARWYVGKLELTEDAPLLSLSMSVAGFVNPESIKGAKGLLISTFRCTGCGYLESYALKPDPKPSISGKK